MPSPASSGVARFEDGGPDVPGQTVGKKQFETVLPGVARACGTDRPAAFFHRDEGVSGRHFGLENLAENARSLRPLHRERTHRVAAVVDSDAIGHMPLQPRNIFINLRRVDQEKKVVIRHTVKDEIVDHAAAFVEEKGILPAADGAFGQIIGEHMLQPVESLRTRDKDLAHVRNVENAA
jgi:hypothetical protein